MPTTEPTSSYVPRCRALVAEFLRAQGSPSDPPELREQKRNQRRIAAFALANLVAENLTDYRMPRWTQRPATLPDDVETWAALDRTRKMLDRAARSDREIVRDFQMWRMENMRAADKLARDLDLLLFSVQALEAVGDPLALPAARRVRDHLKHRFEVEPIEGKRSGEQALDDARRLCPIPSWVWEVSRPRGAFDPGAQ